MTGGLPNPLSILLVVPIALSASVLSLGTTIGLCILVVASASLMPLFLATLPWIRIGLELPQHSEPYVASRRRGSPGLGRFMAQTLLARAGASLHFANMGGGVRYHHLVPRCGWAAGAGGLI